MINKFSSFQLPSLFRQYSFSFTGSVGFHRDLLKKQLNPSFPFDRALSIAIGYSVTIDSVSIELKHNSESVLLWKIILQEISIVKTLHFNQAVSTNRLYVLYHEEHNGLASLNDMLDVNPTDTRDMMNTTSPIALFVKDNTGALKIAAIQIDYLPGETAQFYFIRCAVLSRTY